MTGPIPPGAIVMEGAQLETILVRLLDERRPEPPAPPLTGFAAYKAEWLKPSGIIPLLALICTVVGGYISLHYDVAALQTNKIVLDGERTIFRNSINGRVDGTDKRVEEVKKDLSERLDRGFDVTRDRDAKRAAEIADLAGDVKAILNSVENLVARQNRLEARQDAHPLGENQRYGPLLPFSLRTKNGCPVLIPLVHELKNKKFPNYFTDTLMRKADFTLSRNG